MFCTIGKSLVLGSNTMKEKKKNMLQKLQTELEQLQKSHHKLVIKYTTKKTNISLEVALIILT
jgi:tRNA A22 N-methylase